MAILDNQGRVFGKISILDIGAALVILLVVVGVFVFPGTTGSVAQMGVETKPVEVDVIARGLSASNPEALISELKASKTTNIVIRNQPYGQVELKSVQLLPRSVAVPQPDGSVRHEPDPRPELRYTVDMLLTLGGKAQLTKTGPVLGNNKIKIGTPVQLEGMRYDFNASVVDVRVQ